MKKMFSAVFAALLSVSLLSSCVGEKPAVTTTDSASAVPSTTLPAPETTVPGTDPVTTPPETTPPATEAPDTPYDWAAPVPESEA